MNILMHICCGPCAITVAQRLLRAGHSVTGLFFNPNIHPLAEYLKRREGAANVAKRLGIPLVFADALPTEQQQWFASESPPGIEKVGGGFDANNAKPGDSGEAGQHDEQRHGAIPPAADAAPWLRLMAGKESDRCALCWRVRLWYTAQMAVAGGFDAFSSSLLYSRYQDHAALKKIAESAAVRHHMVFAYEDFRTSWQEGITLSKEWAIYRQQYCGCIYSEYERYSRECARIVAQ